MFARIVLARTILARIVLTAALVALPLHAQDNVEGPQHTRILVRAESKDKPVAKENVVLKLDGHVVPVASFHSVMATDEPVELILALDDGLRGNFATNLASLQRFIERLPANVAVGVGFMQNGRVLMPPGGFEGGRETAVRALRIPQGQPGLSASPYFCIEDLAKHWPSNKNSARMVLMITNGIDPYNGRPTPMNQSSPYVDEATETAQRANVTVYSIFWSSFGISPGFGGFSGESYLAQLSEGTGGSLLSNGTMNPPDIDPFLKRFEKALQQTYIAGFDAPIKRNLQYLRVSSSVSGVKLYTTKAIGKIR